MSFEETCSRQSTAYLSTIFYDLTSYTFSAMAAFSDLPNEIILLIWRCADLKDVYNFSTTSKQTYTLVQHLLPEHPDFQRRLSTISNEDRFGIIESRYFGRVLKEILMNPEASRHPETLKFHGWDFRWDDADFSPDSIPTEADIDLFENAIRQSSLIDKGEMNDWVLEIRKGNEEPLIALLMTLLPNLASIVHKGWSPHAVHIDEVLGNIARAESPKSLKRLRCVAVGFDEDLENPDCIHLDAIRCYSEIPSVETLYGHHVECDEEDLLVTHPPLPLQSNITRLALTDCAIHAKPLSDFLLTMDGLCHFTYTPKHRGSGDSSFEPFWIRTALQCHQRWTLKSLTLLACDHSKSFMGSLDLFPYLEDLETDLVLLLGNLSGTSHGLCTVLPETIRDVKLHVASPEDGLRNWKILEGLKMELGRFPDLARITMKGDISIGKKEEEEQTIQAGLIKDFGAKGVALSYEHSSKE